MTTFRELPFKVTPINYPELVNELLLQWPDHTPVTRKAVIVAAGQIGFESGLTRCYNWMISGIKAKPNNGKTHWQYLTTHERLSPAQVEYARTLTPGAIDIVGDGGDGLILIKVRPKHPYCCFRAYETLREAVADHLATLVKRFPKSWAALQTGDSDVFVHALKTEGYYTGREDQYKAGTTTRLKAAMQAVGAESIIWGDVQ